jgi:hypothetical protein
MGTLKYLCKFPQQKLQNSITMFSEPLQLKHEANNEQTAWYYTITIESCATMIKNPHQTNSVHNRHFQGYRYSQVVKAGHSHPCFKLQYHISSVVHY